MSGKVLFNRDRENQSEQMVKTNLLANHHTDFDNMAACVSQDRTVDSPTKENVKEPVLYMHNLTAVNNSSLRFHIRVLYTIVVCLTLVLVSSLIVCYLEISSLREVLSRQLMVGDLVDFKFPARRVSNDDLQMPYISSEDELSLGGFWEGGSFAEDSASKTRSKRHASFHEGSGAADDWLWMSSFARVPIIALQSYCREAQLYCAAAGKPGPPGHTGQKGDMGEKGEKGDFADETAIALSLAKTEAVRGPPGPKGEKGSEGPLGPMGPKGEVGAPGIPGQYGANGFPGNDGKPGPKGDVGPPGRDGNPGFDGAKGERGVPGATGERGISGMPGVPGLKGLLGDKGSSGFNGLPGLPGPKGEPGYCQVECGETEKTRAYPEGTTPAPTFPPRVRECSIEVVGLPVLEREARTKHGAWMKDLKSTSYKIWVTYGQEGNSIFEYSSYDNFKADRGGREIRLSASPYFGTGHVVYDGHLYYHWSGTPKIVRFDLASGQATTVRSISYMIHKSTKALKWQGFLYQSQTMFVHFNVDQNGLWIIYGNEKSEKITVALLNTENLDIINSVNIELELGSKGGAFIACGKLYTLKHYNRHSSFLDEEHDLWLGLVRVLRLTFKNPHLETYMLTFDHNVNKIYAWDGGKLLTTPLLLKSQ